jgi:hypothetical protein
VIAEMLGCPVCELEERMPATELDDWVTFLTIRREQEEKAMHEARAKNRHGRKGRR